MSGVPEWGTVSMIEPSPFDAATAYVVFDAHRLDDTHPYLFKTSDLGRTWKRLDGSLPGNVYLHAVREDPAKRGQLYLGTERGVLYSTDEGQTWKPLRLNMPTVAVHDLVVKDGNLVVATHGRSLWILDDLRPIRDYTDTVAGEPLHLFPTDGATRWRYGSNNWGTRGAFSNPPHGATIYYSLKAEEKGEVKIEILDSQNRLVRTLSSTPPEPMGSDDNENPEDFKNEALKRDAGIQRAVWDLRYEGARKIKGARIDTGDPNTGPRVSPGTYTVRLTAAGKTLTAPLKVVADPRGDLSQTDLVNTLRSVQEQLKARNSALAPRKSDAGVADLIGESNAAIKKAFAIEDKLHNPTAEVVYDILAMRGGARLYSRLSPLQMWALESSGAPTSGMTQVLGEQEQELAALESETQQFLAGDVTRINKGATQLNLPFVIIK